MTQLWMPGDIVVLREIVNGRTWGGVSTFVVKDFAQETALLLLPGAQTAFPEGYFRRQHGDYSLGTHWQDANSNNWVLRESVWNTNRFLWLLEPDQYYAICYVWNQASGEFQGYYVNFQLPYRRARFGFDSLDLDLDVVVHPDLSWYLKDEDDYRDGISQGGIQQTWVNEIAKAQDEVLGRLQRRQYPFDGSWLEWRPDPEWQPPSLPDGWQIV